MTETGRYDVSGLVEAQYQPGSRGRVLRNLLGISGKRLMDETEAREQKRALKDILSIYSSQHRFTADDICRIHKVWLGGIYEWAGQYRQVNVTKGTFPFAAAARIPHLMAALEKEALKRFTPCLFETEPEVVHALAVVHTELVLIHPFREGNGRVARMLSIVMAAQAGLPPLDFSHLKGRYKEGYFRAVQAGMDYDYKPMEKVFTGVIEKTLTQSGKPGLS
ncbi:MAG: Fic family protein [Deltaproteobacteria bacterium]|nr:Fic family protein [Deltaproteobacteria bacterium]